MNAFEQMTIAMEDIDGKRHREDEITFYAKIVDLHQIIEQANEVEKHEQWTIGLTSKDVRGRLRLIDGLRHTMAFKEKIGESTSNMETESDISEDTFKVLRRASHNGYKKTRYCIPISGSTKKWEVDVFLTNGGATHSWVKVDYEHNGDLKDFPEIPFEYEEIIVAGADSTTAEQEEIIDQLWNVEWSRLDSTRGDLDQAHG